MRQGLEDACQKMGISAKCVFTSEIKEHAIATYQENFQENKIYTDISQVILLIFKNK
jgi:DNA (cytosine-5)-methyltransferase 1